MDTRLTDLAAAVAARVARRAQFLTERYTEPELALTKAEADKHMSDYGHMYDQDCQAEFCQKVRAMYNTALQSVGGA